MKKLISIIGFLFFIWVTTGCGPSYVAVGTRPLPPAYTRPLTPGPRYVWVEGEWIRSRHGYVYRKGYWTVPRVRYHQYNPGHWERRRHGWFWVSGHWY